MMCKRNMRIYIAGAITNNHGYKQDFHECEEKLKKLSFVPLNPVKNIGFDYKSYIDMGLSELMYCDAICIIKGSQLSKGVMLEMHYATTVGLAMYEYDRTTGEVAVYEPDKQN